MSSRLIDVTLTRDSMFLITLAGEFTEHTLPTLLKDAERASEIIKNESGKALKPLPALVDISGVNPGYEVSVFTALANFERDNKPFISYTAIYGGDSRMTFTGEIISAMSGRRNIGFYSTKEEALAALKAR